MIMQLTRTPFQTELGLISAMYRPFVSDLSWRHRDIVALCRSALLCSVPARSGAEAVVYVHCSGRLGELAVSEDRPKTGARGPARSEIGSSCMDLAEYWSRRNGASLSHPQASHHTEIQKCLELRRLVLPRRPESHALTTNAEIPSSGWSPAADRTREGAEFS